MKKSLRLYQVFFKEAPEQYRFFKVAKPITKQVYVLFLFAFLLAVWFVFDSFGVIQETISIYAFMISFAFLFFFPLMYIFLYRGRKILFTPQALTKERFMRKTQIIPFDRIGSVKTNHTSFLTLYGKEKRAKIRIIFKLYDKDIYQIHELLKFQGFFMEPPKAYTILFESGLLQIDEDMTKSDEDTPILFEKYFTKYSFLTPGFIDEIIFYNNQIEKVEFIDNQHIAFYLSHLDVKPGHPENTKFKAQKTDEAFVLFENVEKVTIMLLDKDSGSDKKIVETLETLREITDKAVIFEASLKNIGEHPRIDFVLSSGVQKYSIELTFSQVIIGWNAFADLSWFENRD